VSDVCVTACSLLYFFFSSRRRHTRSKRDWSSDVCSSDLGPIVSYSGSCRRKNGFPVIQHCMPSTDFRSESYRWNCQRHVLSRSPPDTCSKADEEERIFLNHSVRRWLFSTQRVK